MYFSKIIYFLKFEKKIPKVLTTVAISWIVGLK